MKTFPGVLGCVPLRCERIADAGMKNAIDRRLTHQQPDSKKRRARPRAGAVHKRGRP